MAKVNRTHGRISVFKGREAKLNYVIFQVLALKGPQTIYDIHKEVRARKGFKHVRYAGTNKRVRSLEELGYIRKIGVKKTKAGFGASLYELSARAYLAMILNFIDLEYVIRKVDEATASAILGEIIYLIQLEAC